MSHQPLPKALTLLTRDSTLAAQCAFAPKDKQKVLPQDGIDCLGILASHPIFRELTIATFDGDGNFKICTEFHLLFPKDSFDEPKVTGLVFTIEDNTATACSFKYGRRPTTTKWMGPPLSTITKCESIDMLQALKDDKELHTVEYDTPKIVSFFPVELIEAIVDDDEALSSPEDVCICMIEHCKNNAITHLKNKKMRKTVPFHIVQAFEFIVFNFFHEKSFLTIEALDEQEGKNFFSLWHHPVQNVTQENSDNDDQESSRDLPTQDDLSYVSPMAHMDDENVNMRTPANDDENNDLPPLPMSRIPKKPQESESSSDSNSSDDEEIPEPVAKRIKTPTRQNNANRFDDKDLMRLASAFTKAAQDDDSVDENITKYGSKKNKLRKLNSFRIDCLRNACTKDCIMPASTLPESLVSMMESQTAPNLADYIEGTLSKHNISVCIGFCTALLGGTLCNRMITSKSIQGFTNFAFGPREEDSDTYQLQHALQMCKNHGISEDDKKKLLNQKQYIPTDADGLKSSVRNTAAVGKMAFGKDAVITVALKELKNSLKEIDSFLKPYFNSHGSAFGSYFATTIHSGLSIYLSKANYGIKHMKPEYLDFSDLILDIQMQRLRLAIQTIPGTLTFNKENNKNSDNNRPSRGNEQVNKFKDNFLRNDEYRKIFSPRNRQGCEPPKMSDGTPICWNFHSKGRCHDKCKNSHKQLNKDEKDSYNKFIKELNNRAFGSNHRNNGNRNGNEGNAGR